MQRQKAVTGVTAFGVTAFWHCVCMIAVAAEVPLSMVSGLRQQLTSKPAAAAPTYVTAHDPVVDNTGAHLNMPADNDVILMDSGSLLWLCVW